MNKPFVERLNLDEVNLKILDTNKQKIGGFALFKNTFLGQLWNMVKINWLMLAFCIPIVVWLVISTVPQVHLNSTIPYSANIGIGYPIVNYSRQLGLVEDFYLSMENSLMMLIMITFASIGLAGVFNTVKYLCWGMPVKIIKTFFKGIKNSFAPFALVGIIFGLCYMLINFCIYGFDVYNAHLAVKIIGIIISALIILYVLLLSLFIFTQAVMFDLTAWQILKNAFLLVNKFIIQNIIICLIGLLLAPLILLTFNQIVQMIAMMAFFMFSFTFMATIWTIYSHGIFSILYEVKKKNRATATVEITANAPQKRKSSESKKPPRPAFKNPKKKKK